MTSAAAGLFADLPRSRPRRRLMHVIDAGCDMILVKCGHCGHSPGWQPWECGRDVTKYKRGISCPRCNDDALRAARKRGDHHD